jgi:hypothetical protein
MRVFALPPAALAGALAWLAALAGSAALAGIAVAISRGRLSRLSVASTDRFKSAVLSRG